VPPFLLGTLFWKDEQAGRVAIQTAASPDGSRLARVEFLPARPPFAGGSGHIEVSILYRGMPGLRRTIYQLDRSRADAKTRDYLAWRDPDTLFLSEEGKEIRVGRVGWKVPVILWWPVQMGRFLVKGLAPRR
jgi:hypothetical protein